MSPAKAKLWTVDDYHRVVETGVLTGSDRVELDANESGDRHPRRDEIWLTIEVADFTWFNDRQQKALVYAKARLSDYWILDVNTQQISVLRELKSATSRKLSSLQTRYLLQLRFLRSRFHSINSFSKMPSKYLGEKHRFQTTQRQFSW